MNTINLYKAGAVKRWHTKPTLKDQDLAAHQWGVGLILMKIAPNDLELLRAGLTHDLHESEAGDIPYPFKKKNQVVREAYDEQEYTFNQKNGILFGLSDKQTWLLKWADMFELYLWCKREFMLGNQGIAVTLDVAFRALRDMGAPNQAAHDLFEAETGT